MRARASSQDVDVHVRRATPADVDVLLDLYEAVASEGVHIGGEAPELWDSVVMGLLLVEEE